VTVRPFIGALAGGAITVALGIGAMAAYGAPRSFIAINSSALVLAIGLALIARRWRSATIDYWIAGAALTALLATLAFGPNLDGVRRWLAVGPIRLHIGMLLIPALAIAVTRLDARQATGALCAAAIIAALQPDLATALALLAIALVTAALLGGRIRWIAVLATVSALLWCLSHPDGLAPVRFVEHVLVDMAATDVPLAIALGTILTVAILSPLIGWKRADPANRAAVAAFAASLAAFLLASLIGPYPTPLIGAGAASILGWGLGLGRLDAPVGTTSSNR
jgi:hypothetical protein